MREVCIFSNRKTIKSDLLSSNLSSEEPHLSFGTFKSFPETDGELMHCLSCEKVNGDNSKIGWSIKANSKLMPTKFYADEASFHVRKRHFKIPLQVIYTHIHWPKF